MNDRIAIVNQIEDVLGDEGSRELADAIYDRLRARNAIRYDSRQGLLLNPAVDLFAFAREIINETR